MTTPRRSAPGGERLVRVPRSRPLLILALLSATGGVSGCSGDGLTPGKEVAQDELYWALELNHRAVALATPAQAPYDTLTLVATPRTVDGALISGLPAPTYVSGDPEKVAVTSNGMLRAIAPTAPGVVVPVVATLTVGNLKHSDTALVTVLELDPLPVLTNFSIHPTPPDSAKTALVAPVAGVNTLQNTNTCFALPTWTETPFNCLIQLPITVLDAGGTPIPGVPVAFRSSDEAVATVAVLGEGIQGNYGEILAGNHLPPSEVTFYASTTVFGVTKADALPFRFGWPLVGRVHVSRTGFNETPILKVGTGAIIFWQSIQPFAIDINFADPINVTEIGQPLPSYFPPFFTFYYCQLLAICNNAGNIALGPADSSQSSGVYAGRRFPVPGVYDYSSTVLGAKGQIVVVDER